VVEDDERVARFLMRGLQEEGFRPELCTDGHTALSQGLAQTYDLILLDWSLPDTDGLSVLRQWREAGMETPVIIVTARGGVDSVVLGLDAGADDYIEKPFSFEELLARVRAQTRRKRITDGDQTVVTIGSAEVDLKHRTVRGPRGDSNLSNREYGLLTFLLKHRGETLGRTRILDRVWGMAHDPTTNVVDVYIRYLRDKLDEPDGDSVIETVRGRGYRLRARDEP
jgi:DNA-binding response OmpR family regulator